MVIYGLIMSVLVDKIRGEYPGFLQSWYADEFITAGAGAHLKLAISRIESLGPAPGLFLELDKSQFVLSLAVSEKATR